MTVIFISDTDGSFDPVPQTYSITSGEAVSDSFILSLASTVTGVAFDVWTLDGDSVTSVQWSIGTTPGGDLYGGTAITADTLGTIYKDYTDDNDSFSTGNLSLAAGTYYLTLQNASTSLGSAGWDQNDGPSSSWTSEGGSFSYVGDAESFEVLGTDTPEPRYGTLLGMAVVGLIWSKRGQAREQA